MAMGGHSMSHRHNNQLDDVCKEEGNATEENKQQSGIEHGGRAETRVGKIEVSDGWCGLTMWTRGGLTDLRRWEVCYIPSGPRVPGAERVGWRPQS